MSEISYHSHITTLPLRNFIEVAVNENLSALTISGFPSVEQLSEAWATITQEYADAIGDSESRMYWMLYKEVFMLSMDMELVEVCYNLLKNVYVKSFGDQLLELADAKFILDPSNPEQYQHNLNRCVNRCKSLIVKHGEKKARLEAMGKQATENEKPTMEYYQSMLIILSDHAKHEITDTITVFAFCERVKRYQKYCEQLAAAHGRK